MSEEPQNPRIEASKRKISDALELHQHMRSMFGLNPFNILQRVKAGAQNFKAQQAQQTQPQQVQASGNPNPNMGAQDTNNITPQPRTRLLNLGILRSNPQPQAPPPPPTEEQKAEIERQRRLEELEAKKKLAREKQYRLDHLRGLSVDRT
jgi:type IV secretory pathway VirB10-like protein